MTQKLKIKNIFGEQLDLLVEGNEKSGQVVIFVHGFGSDKDEGFASFLEFSKYLQDDFLIIRFDLSGYGASGGVDQEFQFQKAAGDVDSVIRFARKRYPNKEIDILAHSLGTFIVSLLSPYNVGKIVFTSIINSNTKFVSKILERRILSRAGKIDKTGVSAYPRSKGGIQLIGKDFWRTLENFDPIEYITDLAKKTDLAIFKPKQDEVIPNKYFSAYKKIGGIKYFEVNGDHNFKNPEERKELFRRVREFLMSRKTNPKK